MSTSDSSTTSSSMNTTPGPPSLRNPATVLARFPLARPTPDFVQMYLDKTADMFYNLIFDYNNERTTCEDAGITWEPDESLHETAFQTQLLTQAFLDGHYRTPALCIETVDNFQPYSVICLAIDQLKGLYPRWHKEDMEEIFRWLYQKHEARLRRQGVDLDFIEHRLGIAQEVQ